MKQSGHPTAETSWTVADRRLDRVNADLDLGVEPAISLESDTGIVPDRRKVSARWLAGTALTGLAGASLIASAVVAALNERSHIATAPEYVAREQDPQSINSVNQRKGDRLVRPVNIVAARQTFNTPTIVRVGKKEIVRRRTFTRVSTTMTLHPTGLASDVPRFNPLKLLAGAPSATANPADLEIDRTDADVTFVSRDLSADAITPDKPALSIQEIQAQVTEHLKNNLNAPDSKPLPIPPQLLLIKTSRAAVKGPGALAYASIGSSGLPSAFRSIRVKMIAENVSVIAKNTSSGSARDNEERLAVVKRGQSITNILKAEGATNSHIAKIRQALTRMRIRVREGQKLKLLKTHIDGGQSNSPAGKQIARLSIYDDETFQSAIAMNDDGNFEPVATVDNTVTQARQSPRDRDSSLRLYNSFYETALKHQIPRAVISSLVSMFANDIDFNRTVAGGDSFEVFYRNSESKNGSPDILFASVSVRGQKFKYYRAPAVVNRNLGYYDENGRSSRKFLIRKPVAAGRQRSGFGYRRHPILRYVRLHRGVDWAAKTGTPIVAAGNGRIVKAKRMSGYGNRIEIKHANGYVTTYSHMVGFARGMREGLRVRQGQVIGYVGSTGLSTGAHLHYEVIVNGSYVNPLRIRLARTKRLTSKQLREFQRERDRIERLIAKAPLARRVASRTPSN